jgi:hypothetical protein
LARAIIRTFSIAETQVPFEGFDSSAELFDFGLE